MGKKRVIERTREVVGGDDDDLVVDRDLEDPTEDVALFDDDLLSAVKATKLHIHRTEPDEGFLGEVGIDTTEQDLRNRWGGSVYKVIAKNAQSKIVKVRSIRISGDPIFESEAAEILWRRQKGLKPKGEAGANDNGALRLPEVLTLLETRRQEEARERREREEDNAQRAAEREERLRREAEERDERRRRDDAEREERRLRLQREDEERRERRHREDLERQEKAMQQQVAAQQQQFQQTIALFQLQNAQKDARDPVELMLKGLQLGKELGGEGGGGGGGSTLDTLLANAPQLLDAIRSTSKDAQAELAGAEAGGGGGDAELTITGPTAKLLKAAAIKLQRQGKDPEKLLQGIAVSVLKSGGGAKPAPAGKGAQTKQLARRAPNGGNGRPKGAKDTKPRKSRARKPPAATKPALAAPAAPAAPAAASGGLT